MLIKKAEDIRSSEITPKKLYLNRRQFLAGAAVAGAAAAGGLKLREAIAPSSVLARNKINGIQKRALSTTEAITPYNDVTHYNNYYEFATSKPDPADMAKDFRTR